MQGNGGAQLHPADVVHPDRRIAFGLVQRVDVHAVLHFLDHAPRIAGGVLDRVLATGHQWTLVEPAEHHVDVLTGLRRVVGAHDHVAAADIDLVGQGHHHALRGEGLLQFPFTEVDALDRALESAGQHLHGIPDAEHAPGDTSCEATEIMVLIGHRAHDILHREPAIDVVQIACDVDVLQRVHQRWTLVPVHAFAAVHHIIALQRTDGDVADVAHLELAAEI